MSCSLKVAWPHAGQLVPTTGQRGWRSAWLFIISIISFPFSISTIPSLRSSAQKVARPVAEQLKAARPPAVQQVVLLQYFWHPLQSPRRRRSSLQARILQRVLQDKQKPRVSMEGTERNTRVLKLYQLNTAKRTESGNALSRIMGSQRNTLAFITEPPIYRGKVCGFPSLAFNTLYHQGGKNRCRAAIVASKGVITCPLPYYTDEDTASAVVVLDGRKTCVVSSYMDIKADKIPDMVHKVSHFAAVNGYGLLICTDSNAHSPLWGSPDLNRRGRLVDEDLIYRYGLQLLNTGSATLLLPAPLWTSRWQHTGLQQASQAGLCLKRWSSATTA